MQAREMSSAAGGTWSTCGFIFAHWTGVFSFSQRHPAHPTPLPTNEEGKQPSKSKARYTLSFLKGTLEVIPGWWVMVMGDVSFFL